MPNVIMQVAMAAGISMFSASANLFGAMIPASDANVRNGLSPYNWVCRDGYISSTVNAASLTLRFKGTRQVTLRVDMEHMKAMTPSHYPVIAWAVNGGAFQSRQLLPEDKSIVLSTGAADPKIDLYVKGMSPYGDRFNGDTPSNSIKITGFGVDEGGSTAAVALPDKVWLSIGDSIMSGDGALRAKGQGRPAEDSWAASDDGRASYGYLLASHYGYREAHLAYGGYNWTGGMANMPPLVMLIDQITSTVSRLNGETLSPLPDIVLINLGENGIPADKDVIASLGKLRSCVNAATKIVAMIPVSQKGRAEITQTFNSYKDSTSDSNAFLVDLGSITYDTGDGQHPTAAGHQAIYKSALPYFDKIIGKAATAAPFPGEPVEGSNMPKAADPGDAKMAKETQERKNARMQWWRDARYGLFIHWGPSSILGTETSWGRNAKRPLDCDKTPPPNNRDEVYDNLYKQFNPVDFNAQEWVQIAKDAGMKYIVFTTKHHDGFSNFHTKYSDYGIASTAFKRDIVRELADACHKGGLRFGVYYSPRDWHHPDYLIDGNKKYQEFFYGQLQELLSNYGKVDIIWFDSMGGDWKDWDYPRLADVILSRQPDILCNGRIGVLQATTPRPDFDFTRLSDFQSPEQVIGAFQRDAYWESCATLVDGQWGYKPDGLLLTFRETLGMVLYCAGGDGNLLLDVGPMPTGQIESRQAKRLKDVGDWLARYGDTIYGTRGGPYKPGYWGVCTLKGNKVFLHCLSFEGDTLALPALGAKVISSRLLTGGDVSIHQSDDSLVAKIAPKDRQQIVTIIELTIDRPAFEIKPITVPKSESLLSELGRPENRQSISVQSNAPAKRWWHNPCGAHRMFDDCRLTSWVPDSGTTEASVTLDLGKPIQFTRGTIDCEGCLDSLEVMVKDGDAWKSIGSFQKPGSQTRLAFKPTTAQAIKLVFKTADRDMFRVWEFQLFPG